MSERLLSEHVSSTVLRRLRRLSSCAQFREADDPVEALHDLRVASRRLRAFLDVFEPVLGATARKRAGKPLRRLTRAVRALRDWDVQIGLLTRRTEGVTTDLERAAIEHLLERATHERASEEERSAKRRAKVDDEAVNGSIREALDTVLAHLSNPETDPSRLAWELLDPLARELEHEHPPDDGVEHVEQMHRLRLSAKKLRYAIELFEPAFGEQYAGLHERVSGLQQLLGEHHDLAVLGAFVESARADLEQRSRGTLARGLATLRDELSVERRLGYEKFREARYAPGEWRSRIARALLGDAGTA